MRLLVTEEAVAQALKEDWYYSIELLPAQFTRGKEYANVALTRDLLRRCDVAGHRCLDIGTMEGLVPVVLCRRGAAQVVAVDGLNLRSRINLVQAAHGAEFEYFGNVAASKVVEFLLTANALNAVTGTQHPFGFDIVVLSGVLYHVFSPIHVLGAARSCLKDGGLLLIETAAIRTNSYVLQFNFTGTGYIYDWTDIWFPSPALLDYLCRLLNLAPLDCIHLESTDPYHPDVIRLGIVCRATDGVLPGPGERFMQQSTWNMEYASVLSHSAARPPRQHDVLYDLTGRNIVCHPTTGTCDLAATIEKNEPLRYAREDIVLRLGQSS